jgi:hypothetical protein
MPPAVIAAGVVAAGTIGGAVLGSKSQSKATAQAAQTQDNATAAQLQLGQESLGLNKDIYNSNYDILSPYVSRGNVAGGAINSLLGLPAAPAMHSPLATTTPTPTPGTTAPPPVPQVGGTPYPVNAASVADPAATMNPLSAINARRADRGQPPVGHARTTPTPSPAGAATSAHSTPASQAMQNFANSAGMQFQLQQGTNALNNLYAAHGMLQSGAAMKGINDYAQQTALNNYFMPYMGFWAASRRLAPEPLVGCRRRAELRQYRREHQQ